MEEATKKPARKRAPAATKPKQPADLDKATPVDILSDQQWAFVQEYLTDFRGTRAYMKIYGQNDERNAASCASKLLTTLNIREAVEYRLRELALQYDIQQMQILKHYAAIAFFDIRKLYDENGNLKHVRNLDDLTASAIKSVEHRDLYDKKGEIAGYIHKITMHDKVAALERLELYVGMAKEKEEQGEAGRANVNMVFVFPNKYPLDPIPEAEVAIDQLPPKPQNGETK